MYINQNEESYQYTILQSGSLPLKPNGKVDFNIEHKCTSLLLWPENQEPTPENTILADPCLTPENIKVLEQKLQKYRMCLSDIQYFFISHKHRDHLPTFSYDKNYVKLVKDRKLFSGISTTPCTGHAHDLKSMVFQLGTKEEIWFVGDAVLNKEWLKAWGYYWPNRYTEEDVVQTWKSLAKILSQADIVIPGHGMEIRITSQLLKELIQSFPQAKHSERCFSVEALLKKRMKELKEIENA